MATERLISAQANSPEEEHATLALRPTALDEYVGQVDLKERLTIAIEAGRARSEPVEHVLFHGPPGLGKTTLAHVVAQEMGARLLHVTSGPALDARHRPRQPPSRKLQPNDVLFIDEIHRMPAAVEEFIYPAMEDCRIDVTVDSGLHARTVHDQACKPFTLVGATTRPGLLSSPLRSRFGIDPPPQLLRHARPELHSIVRPLRARCSRSRYASGRCARASSPSARRGTPRIANRLLRRVRDYAQVRADGRISPETVDKALTLEGVDALGLDELDRAYLRTIATTYEGGPVGLETVAATMNEDAGTLEDVVEPYLLQIGFLARTRRGRALTRLAAEHLGISIAPKTDANLFN